MQCTSSPFQTHRVCVCLGYRWGSGWSDPDLWHHQVQAGDRGQCADGRQHRQRGGRGEVLWDDHRCVRILQSAWPRVLQCVYDPVCVFQEPLMNPTARSSKSFCRRQTSASLWWRRATRWSCAERWRCLNTHTRTHTTAAHLSVLESIFKALCPVEAHFHHIRGKNVFFFFACFGKNYKMKKMSLWQRVKIMGQNKQ